jgi:predicted esterase
MKPPDDHPSSSPGSRGIADLGFVHVFMPAAKPAPDAVTLLLLHGTGGDERELLPLGRELWPGAALLGVRGHVLENGAPRFFCRLAEGGFDVYDLKERTSELAHSNGANIAASLIFLHPHYLAARHALQGASSVLARSDPKAVCAHRRRHSRPTCPTRSDQPTCGHLKERRSGPFDVLAPRRSRTRE